MANDGRCSCGCRIFYDRPTRITTASGAAFNIPTIAIVECVNCGAVCKIVGEDGERKTVVPFVSGKAAEKELFAAAVSWWKNEHRPELKMTFVTVEDADKADYERHGIPRPVVEVNNEPVVR